MPGFPPQAEMRELTCRMDLPADHRICWVDAEGHPLYAAPRQTAPGPEAIALHRDMVWEAFRRGEVHYRWLTTRRMAVGLPLCLNQELMGGVVVDFPLPEGSPTQPSEAARSAWSVLEAANLLNLALLREHAVQAAGERLGAQATHDLKRGAVHALRGIYYQLEPDLFMAMRRGDQHESRRLLNQILTGIYSFGFDDLRKTKGYIIDLMTLISRTIVECGADPEEMIGDNLANLTELATLDDEEELSRWVGDTFEKLIRAMESAPDGSRDMRVHLVRHYLREHCGQPLSRDAVARRIGLSSAHFSRLFKAATGQTFTDYLRQVRVEKAARLLRQTDWTILAVGMECGLDDASYFTKVFKQVMGVTPLAFRRKARKF